jgi:hypothetical protein
MGKEGKATRTILIIVCLLAVAPMVMAALVQIAAHELRYVSDFSAPEVSDQTIQGSASGNPIIRGPI